MATDVRRWVRMPRPRIAQRFASGPRDHPACLEYQDPIGFHRPGGQLFHAAAMCPIQQFGVGDAARIQTCPTDANRDVMGDETFEHAPKVIRPLWRHLSSLSATNRISQQKDFEGNVALFAQRQPQAQGIVAALGPIGWIVENEQIVHTNLTIISGSIQAVSIKTRTMGAQCAQAPLWGEHCARISRIGHGGGLRGRGCITIASGFW
jgi:hypothetical protein